MIRLNRRTPKILAYHACEPSEHELIRGLNLNTPPDAFAAQLEFLGEHYPVVPLEQLGTDECPDGAVAITFDDGYRSVYDHAFPPLRDRGWPATVFLVADAVDNARLVWVNELLYFLQQHPDTTGAILERCHGIQRSWQLERIINRLIEEVGPGDIGATLAECRTQAGVTAQDVAAEAQLYLSRAQIAEMAGAGVTFGNHTVSHPNLMRLDADGQRDEVRGAREALRLLPGYIDAFAYPFGSGTEAVGAMAVELGHQMVLELGGWNTPFDRRSVARIRVYARSPAALFAEMEVVAPIKGWLKRRVRKKIEAEHVPLSRRRSRVRGILVNLSLLLVSVLLTLAAAEGVVRLLAPQQLIVLRPDIWHGVDSLGWFRRPFVDSTINTGERSVHIVTDGHGFRISRHGRQEADVNILLLGDSFMEALQVEYAQSTAGLLEQRLSERVGRPVAVHNSAHAGWDPNHYRIAAEKFLGSESYEMVLVALYIGNDVVGQRVDYFPPRSPIRRHHLHIPRSFRWRDLVDALLYPINDFLEVRSHLFILLKTRGRGLLMRVGLTAAYFPLTFRTDHAQYAWWDVTAEICRSIAHLAAAQGIPAVFALVPAPQQVDEQSFREYLRGFRIDTAEVDLEQPNRLLGQALRNRGLSVIDPLQVFRAVADSGARLYGAVDNHFNPRGHEVFTDALVPGIAPYLERALVAREGQPTSGVGSVDAVRQ